MKMSNSETEFDYQSVLETCELQGQSVKKALDEKNQSDSSYKNELVNLKTLKREWKEKNETMFEISLMLKRNLQKLENTMNRQSIVNKEITSVQLKTTSLNSDLKKQSDDSMRKTAEMDQNLQKLHTHFDERTLEAEITNVTTDLLSSQDIEIHLQNEFQKLLNTHQFEFKNTYARCMILKMLKKKLGENLGVTVLKKKIAEKRKNIQFLTNQIEKMSVKL
ncbi:unnamed protein product [Phaedon cochleariae]|uniref:Uncharacterized protein n=1 Tax=Phaedon cochleariae TaxID=80249 RepID=A0A9N9SJ05_PHACE|nr:unnamed protein product [Phaedon cochleariae]